MGQVTITLNGRTYRLKCGDGEEARLIELARYLGKKINGLASEFGQVGDDRLTVMAALLITDELFDARTAKAANNGNADADHAAMTDDDAAAAMGTLSAPSTSHVADDEPAPPSDENTVSKPEPPAAQPAPPKPAANKAEPPQPVGARTSLEERLAAARGEAPGTVRRTGSR